MGGFESQCFQIFENLKKLGENVKWYYEVSSIDKTDILQVMSTDKAMISFIMKEKNAGAKIVLTPMQGSRAISNFYLKIANRLSHIPQLCTSHLLTNRMIGLADHITPLCSFEANRMTEVYGVPKSRITVIPNGINHIRSSACIHLPFSLHRSGSSKVQSFRFGQNDDGSKSTCS